MNGICSPEPLPKLDVKAVGVADLHNPGLRLAFIRGPEGIMIELVQG